MGHAPRNMLEKGISCEPIMAVQETRDELCHHGTHRSGSGAAPPRPAAKSEAARSEKEKDVWVSILGAPL